MVTSAGETQRSRLAASVSYLPAMEREMERAGAPWTQGRLPEVLRRREKAYVLSVRPSAPNKCTRSGGTRTASESPTSGS